MTLTAHFSDMVRAIAFDLDDTLINTSGLLAPKATIHAFEILRKNGLALEMEACERIRQDMIKSVSHKEVFIHLAKQYGTELTQTRVQEAIDAFYSPILPDHLPLLPGALDNLKYLKNKYELFVVTAGFEISQKDKIRALGIKEFFKQIYVIDSLARKRKRESFQKIIQDLTLHPQELLCIGNSLSSEMKDGVELGTKTCLFEFGEDRGEAPVDLMQKIDFKVKNHFELIDTCRL